MPWNLDPRVRSAMISDSLDVVGVRNNAMDIRVRALRPEMRAVGLAATVKFVPSSEYDQKDPYGAGIDFLDTLQVGEIAVISIYFILPFAPAGVPGNKDFTWTAVNYAPILTGGALIFLWVWWHVSVKKWFTGPKTTI